MKRASQRRADLLNASIEYILQNGLAELSLRPLAAAVGSKARLLIYHFGTKDRLVAEAMIAVRERVQNAFAELVHDGRGHTPAQIIRAFWKWATFEKHEKYLRLFFEVHALALQKSDPYDRYLKGAVATWVDMMSSVLPSALPKHRRSALATLAVAAVIGLLLDYLSSHDAKRTSYALEMFVKNFASSLSNELSAHARG